MTANDFLVPTLKEVKTQIGAALTPALAQNLTASGQYTDLDRGRLITKDFFGLHPRASYNHVWQTGWDRLHDTGTFWRNIEPTTKGTFVWTTLNALLDKAVATGQKVLIMLGQAPNWATGGVNGGPYGTSYNNLSIFSNQNWTDYITALAAHVKAYLPAGWPVAYEAWNEPDHGDGFYNGTVARLVELTQLAYGAIKAVDPTALMVGPSPTGQYNVSYLEELFQAGLASYIDVVACHLYVFPSGPEAMIDLGVRYKVVADTYAPGKPIWNTEFTWNSYTDATTGVIVPNTVANGTVAMPDAQQVNYIIRMFLACMAAGFDTNFLYGLKLAWPTLAILQSDYSTVTPAGQALWDFQHEMIGSRIVSYACSPQGVHSLVYIHSSGERKVWVWASDSIIQSINNDKNLQLSKRRNALAAAVSTNAGATTITGTPALFTLGNDLQQPLSPLAFAATGGTVNIELLANPGLTLNTAAAAPYNWTSSTPVTAYTGSDAPAGTTPVTFTPTGQYHQIRQVIPQRLIGGNRYRAEIVYKGGDAGKYSFSAEMGQVGATVAGGAATTLGQSAEFTTTSFEFDYTASTPSSPETRVSLVYTGTSGFPSITIAKISFKLINTPNVNDTPIRRRFVDAYPTTGNWYLNEQAVFTTNALIAQYGTAVVCSQSGTFGALVGVTATTALNSEVITVNLADSLNVGDVITIAGSAPGGSYIVTQKISSTSYRLNVKQTSAVAGAAVAYVNPAFVQPRSQGSTVTKTTQSAAYWPDNTTPGVNGPDQYILTTANKIVNGSGELGGSNWNVVSGSFANATSGTSIAGPARYFDLAGTFEVYQDAPIFRQAKPVWFTIEVNSLNSGATLEYQLDEYDASSAFVATLQAWTALPAGTKSQVSVTPSNTNNSGYIRTRLRSTVAGQKQFRGIGIWHGLPGAVIPGGFSESIRWLFDNKVTAPSAGTLSLLSTNQGQAYILNTGMVTGPTRYVTTAANKLKNTGGELGGDGWNVVSGTFVTASSGSTSTGGAGRMFDLSSVFEVYQDIPGFYGTESSYFTVETNTINASTSLEYKISSFNASAVETVLQDWTVIPAATSLAKNVTVPNPGAGAYVRVSLRSTATGQKQFRALGFWTGLPGVQTGAHIEAVRWLYDNKVSTTQAATTAVLGLVKKAAALTATTPSSATLTVSATPTQAEIQAIESRQRQIIAWVADLIAKQQTAGQQT